MKKRLSISDIVWEVAAYYEITVKDLRGRPRRTKQLCMARNACYFFIRRRTNASLSEIAAEFSGRHHTTIMFGARQFERVILTDVELYTDAQELLRRFQLKEKATNGEAIPRASGFGASRARTLTELARQRKDAHAAPVALS